MKDRILQIMKQEQMTQQEFASVLEISPASLSSIFNGRTNPTNNHVQAIHRCFPDISISWLMFGEGEMYAEGSTDKTNNSRNDSAGNGLLFDDTLTDKDERHSDTSIVGSDEKNRRDMTSASANPELFSSAPVVAPIIKETIKYIDKPQRKITEIRIFFDDGTFETFSAR
ncbi:MAG: helix-turn-helix transcriptional regulator [Clostridium sp.]|nr:helix-turn-helix transcriptional regulator [Clostridium sp.]